MRELIKTVVVKVENVQFFNIVDILDKDKDVVLHISMIDKRNLNISMQKEEADTYLDQLVAKYHGMVVPVEGYVINLEEIEYASLEEPVQGVTMLHIQFLDNALDIPMSEEKIVEYLDDMVR